MDDEIEYYYVRGKGWQPGYKDTLDFLEEFDKSVAESVYRYLTTGVLTPHEVTHTRFGGVALYNPAAMRYIDNI